MTDWAAEHAAVDRQLKVAAFIQFFVGLVFSLVGLLAAAIVYTRSQNTVVAGVAAAGGMVAGLVVSRRARKVLLGVPLVVEGPIRAKQADGAVVVMDVRAGYRLHPTGERVVDPECVGPRSIAARPEVFATLAVDQDACLVCLPNGLAVRRVAPDQPDR